MQPTTQTAQTPPEKPTDTPARWTNSGAFQYGDYKIKNCVSTVANPGTPISNGKPEMSAAHLQPDDFTEVRVLGKGAAGVVVLAVHKNDPNELFAIKIINISSAADYKMIAQEIAAIVNPCPYLVKAYTAYIREKRLHIVQEYMDKGSLYDVLRCHTGGVPEPVLARMASAVLNGLAHLHSPGKDKGNIHRDLKPANILVSSSGQVKISDFGVVTTDNTKGHSTFVGTTTYMSPERIKGERYSAQSDMWSAGLVFCECILGQYPFQNKTTFIQLLVEITKPQSFEFPVGTSASCQDFIMSCLQQKPEDRPTAAALLQHAWLQEHSGVTQEDVARWLAGVEIRE